MQNSGLAAHRSTRCSLNMIYRQPVHPGGISAALKEKNLAVYLVMGETNHRLLDTMKESSSDPIGTDRRRIFAEWLRPLADSPDLVALLIKKGIIPRRS